MKIAVSGTHCIGKTTLIEDFVAKHNEFIPQREAYYQLQESSQAEFELELSYDNLAEQLDLSIEQLNQASPDSNLIYDRCPIDYIAYLLSIENDDMFDINNSEIADRFDDIRDALQQLDLIVFLPLSDAQPIDYVEDDPEFREHADQQFKHLYREDPYDLFPNYSQPKIIEVFGDREQRIQQLHTIINN